MGNSSQPPKWKSGLEITKMFADTVNAIVPIIKLIASIAAVFLVVLFVQAQFDNKDKIDVYIAEATRFKAEAETAVSFAEELKVQVSIKEAEAAQSIARANRLNAQVASLRSETNILRDRLSDVTVSAAPLSSMEYTELLAYAETVVPLQDSIIQSQETTIALQENQIFELRSVVDLKDQSIFLLTQSRDSLQIVLRNPPTVPKNPNKVFGITLPSRRASFVAGILIGTAATVSITR
jgi:hypothetical protein